MALIFPTEPQLIPLTLGRLGRNFLEFLGIRVWGLGVRHLDTLMFTSSVIRAKLVKAKTDIQTLHRISGLDRYTLSLARRSPCNEPEPNDVHLSLFCTCSRLSADFKKETSTSYFKRSPTLHSRNPRSKPPC